MKIALALLFLALLALPLSAASLNVIKPVDRVVEDGSDIYLGKVGPGQSVFLEADAEVKAGGKFGIGGRWDRLIIDKVPEGWSSENSLLYEQPLKARIRVAANAPDGDYEILAHAEDLENKEDLGQVNLKLKVTVSRDVFSMDIAPKSKETGATQPATYIIKIVNDGVASDAFEISATGLPSWDYRKTIFVPYGTTKEVPYDLVSNEEGEYDVYIKVRSVSSDLLSGGEKVHLSVSTTLQSDYKATNNGLLLFPVFEQAAYALMGLISNLF